jgi:hypothetical protein
MKQIKSFVPDEVYTAFQDYCRSQCASMSAMVGKLIIGELSRRGRSKHQENEVWVKVSKRKKEHSL